MKKVEKLNQSNLFTIIRFSIYNNSYFLYNNNIWHEITYIDIPITDNIFRILFYGRSRLQYLLHR